jgi:hypothetical protein
MVRIPQTETTWITKERTNRHLIGVKKYRRSRASPRERWWSRWRVEPCFLCLEIPVFCVWEFLFFVSEKSYFLCQEASSAVAIFALWEYSLT